MTTSHGRRCLLLIACLLVLLISVWLIAGRSPTPAKAEHAAPARLLALARHVATNSEQLATVDLATGVLTPLGAGLAGCCTTNVLDAALDSTGNTYYAVMARSGEGSPRIVAFNTASGQPSYSPPLTSTLAINYMAFDRPSGQLLALSFNAATLATAVVRLDPASGAATVLNTLPNCCTPRAFDAAYDAETRRLYLVVTPYDGTTAPRLLTISGSDGSVLADLPLDPELAINHMAYDESSDTLWAVVNDAPGDAQRLARIDPASGALTPLGAGVAGCCALLVTDAAVDAASGVLVVPMIDTTAPGSDDIPRFYRFALADGALLGNPAIDPAYALHYVAFDAPDTAQATPTGSVTPTASPSVTPTVTRTPTVTPTSTITPTPLPPRLYLPALGHE